MTHIIVKSGVGSQQETFAKKANALKNWFGHANAIMRKASGRTRMKSGRSVLR